MELTLKFKVCICPLCKAEIAALEMPDAPGEFTFFKVCDDWYDWEVDEQLRVIDQLEPLDHQGPPPGRVRFLFSNGDDDEDIKIEATDVDIKVTVPVSP